MTIINLHIMEYIKQIFVGQIWKAEEERMREACPYSPFVDIKSLWTIFRQAIYSPLLQEVERNCWINKQFHEMYNMYLYV